MNTKVIQGHILFAQSEFRIRIDLMLIQIQYFFEFRVQISSVN
jgi:hypothetical protein